jgi:hypothetical protein
MAMPIHFNTLRAWLTRHWKVVVVIAVAALAGGATFAVASVPDSSGVIHLCYVVTKPANGEPPVPITTAPNVTVIDPSAGQSCSDIKTSDTYSEQPLTLDQTGAQGPAGVNGAPGAQGPAGPQGLAGLTTTVRTLSTVVVGQVTLKRPAQGKVGKAPASLSFDALSVALDNQSKHGSITIVKQVDASSPQLLQAMAARSVFPSAAILLDGPNSKPTVRYTLTNVVIARSEISGAGSVATQSLTLDYQKVEVQEL